MLYQVIKSGFKIAAIGILVATTAIKGPEIHYNWVRNKVKPATVVVTNEEGNSGGSGFHVKAPSGQVYIMTNAHVCEVGKNGVIYIQDDYGRSIPRQIIEVSKVTDLCLVQALPNPKSYLKVGAEPKPGQIVAAVGHPQLMPTTMSRGEVIGQQEVDVLDHFINPTDPEDRCDLPKNKKIRVNTFFGPQTACVVHINANLTTAVILPGNSGSPVVGFYGELVGVFFAGNQANWGLAVTLKDVKQVLSVY